VTLYVDASALLKRYIEEPDSEVCERQLLADPIWLAARHVSVEVRRNLARLLEGDHLQQAREQFLSDWRRINVIELDEVTCAMAADIAEVTHIRTLDALHLAAASRVGKEGLTLLTFDVRLAQAARSLGFQVAGA
jgi:predicted nucleic acid-binding protein